MILAVFLLFVAFVIGEVASIALVEAYAGGWVTLAVLAAGLFLGVGLLTGRVLRTLEQALHALVERRPIRPVLLRSAELGVIGLLLASPGLLSDALAIALLVPAIRRGMERAAMTSG